MGGRNRREPCGLSRWFKASWAPETSPEDRGVVHRDPLTGVAIHRVLGGYPPPPGSRGRRCRGRVLSYVRLTTPCYSRPEDPRGPDGRQRQE